MTVADEAYSAHAARTGDLCPQAPQEKLEHPSHVQ